MNAITFTIETLQCMFQGFFIVKNFLFPLCDTDDAVLAVPFHVSSRGDLWLGKLDVNLSCKADTGGEPAKLKNSSD